ncbi:RING-H2 finger protein ATL56-like [Phalaenopsis equestris]|uniref:RING-H2 finger protein ATL56-like n=1 Tax=Phalaenopsis equestris TaxID=78828 RepID=UPI0009E2D566|nr:RING-H2 finger protein ATL56-like [Phalaenopsis equestris]
MLLIFSVALLLVGIVVVVMIHACVVGWTIGRIGNVAEAEDYRHLIKGLSADELEKLPCYDYRSGEKGRRNEGECAVCLDGFQVGDRCRLLPICRHSFHANCVDFWLMKTAICPVCRSRVRESLSGLVSGDRLGGLRGGGEGFGLQEIEEVEFGVRPGAPNGSAALE